MNFRFLNIPVFIHPTFWIFLLLFTNIYRGFSIESIILGVVLILSLLVHEYGHALTALFFGARPQITLEAFGGNAQYNSYRMSPKQQFIITLNGPLLESLLIALSYALLKLDIFDNYYIRFFLVATLRLNILWCLLNLIPIAPLDGGYLVRYLLEKRFGPSGYKASMILGIVCAAAVAPILFYLGYFFFGALLIIFGYQNFQILQKSEFSSVNQFSYFYRAIEAIKNNEFDTAKTILKRLVKSKDKQIRNYAMESLAKIYFLENEGQKAYELLMNVDPELLKEGKCLLCKLAFDQKNYGVICKYAADIYTMEPTYEIALLISKAFACLHQPAHAGAWLHTASLFENASKESINEVLLHQIYDSVRDQVDFKNYAEKI